MTDAQKHAATLREWAANGFFSEFKETLLAGAEALESNEVKVTRVMDPDAAAYHARIATHCDRLEAIQERIAKALEPKAQGRWRMDLWLGRRYFIPADRMDEWLQWHKNAEPGEPSAIVPEWAKPVPDDVVITGWEG